MQAHLLITFVLSWCQPVAAFRHHNTFALPFGWRRAGSSRPEGSGEVARKCRSADPLRSSYDGTTQKPCRGNASRPSRAEGGSCMSHALRGWMSTVRLARRPVHAVTPHLRTPQRNAIARWAAMATDERGSTSAELLSEARMSVQLAEDFAARVGAEVEGAERLVRQLRREGAVAEQLCSGQLEPTPERLQGLSNNLRGLNFELRVAEWAPGLTALRKRFAVRPPSVDAKYDEATEVVEVDVVAQDGHLWIECKAIGTDEGLGVYAAPARLVEQASALVRAAAAPCNRRRWAAPRVALLFPADIDDDLRRELTDTGALVLAGNLASTGARAEDALPQPPEAPRVANLDVTALFALVSEVSNGGASSPEVQAWAQKQPQHSACVEAELYEPLELWRALEGRPLIAAASAVSRFEKILGAVGGPREKIRWEKEWRNRVHVVETPWAPADTKSAYCTSDKGRVWSLKRIARNQLEVFETGESARALTFTANGKAVSSAVEQGVHLEAQVHRAVWLVGL